MLGVVDRAILQVLHDAGWPANLDPIIVKLCDANRAGHTVVPVSEQEYAALSMCTALVQESPGRGLLTLTDKWLAFERHAAQEARIADWFLERVDQTTLSPAIELNQLMPHADRSQQDAIMHALTHQTSLILGGPGTGKTTTAAAMIVAHRLAAPADFERIQLLAPTGKAAVRLTESLWQAIQAMPIASELIASIPRSARTIHSQLRSLDEAQLVLVDEASMISVELMDQLLAALPRSAKVIWLGDPNQLASVEAGHVLGSLATHPHTAPLRITLNRRHRIEGDQWLSALQDHTLAGNAEALESCLRDRNALVNPDDRATIAHVLEEGYREYFEAWAGGETPESCEFQCLAAIQRGPQGIDVLNQLVSTLSHRYGLAGRGTRILVTENQPHLGLYNGDIGVVLDTDHVSTRMLRFGIGNPQITLNQLSRPMLAYALSIHRSQGSEYRDVLIALPSHRTLKHAQVTREMLFTAMTRAKRQVTLWAHPDDLKKALGTRTRRFTGLPDFLDMRYPHRKSLTLR